METTEAALAELVDPVEYARTINRLRKAAETVARPLLDNGADATTVRTAIRDIAFLGVSDAIRDS